MYTSSRQNKLNLNNKEKKTDPNLYFRKQFMGMYSNSKTVFIKKNEAHIEINFNGNCKKEFCFCFLVYDIKLNFGIITLCVGGKNCIMKNENCIVFP